MRVPASADVVVVGGGNAALCAALEARRFCDRVVIVESANKEERGGNTRHTRNIRHIHRSGDDFVTGTYTEDEMWNDLVKVSGPDINEDLASMVIRKSEECPAFMESHGVHWQASLKGTLNLSRTNRFFLGGGKAIVNAYYTAAARAGIEVLYETRAVDILIDNGLANGVRVATGQPETVLDIPASTVVVASGGFEANIDWLAEYWGDAARQFAVRGSPHNTGTILRALLDQGAASVGDPKGAHAICVDARSPRFDGGIVTRIDAVPLGITVNVCGERFSDEGADIWPHRYASWGQLIADQPEQKAFAIFDSRVAGTFIPPAFPPIGADTIKDLAHKLQLPAETFEQTVARYNAAVPRGAEIDQSKLDGNGTVGLDPPKSNWARPIDRSPFYAFPLRPGITFTFMGLAVDDQARVVFGSVGSLPNLFAAGEVVSGNILTKGYLAGFGLTIGTVFGRIAGAGAGAFVVGNGGI